MAKMAKTFKEKKKNKHFLKYTEPLRRDGDGKYETGGGIIVFVLAKVWRPSKKICNSKYI